MTNYDSSYQMDDLILKNDNVGIVKRLYKDPMREKNDHKDIVNKVLEITQKKQNYREVIDLIDSDKIYFEEALVNFMLEENYLEGLFYYVIKIDNFKYPPAWWSNYYRRDCYETILIRHPSPKKLKEEIIEHLQKQDKSTQIKVFTLLLWIDSFLIISKEHSKVDFEYQYLNRSIDIDSNYNNLVKEVKKLLKNHKTIQALFVLNKYGGFSYISEAKIWCDLYIDTFIKMKRYDILAKYYDNVAELEQNLDFLKNITNYFIEQKDFDKAKNALSKISYLSPANPFIKISSEKIERLCAIKNLSLMGVDFENIDNLSGRDFEQLLINKFIEYGFKVKDTATTGDFGADIILDAHDDTRFVIQCKRFKSKVNLKAVQEVVGALSHYNGDIGLVITSSSFLPSAKTLAESNRIELWDGDSLVKFLSGDLSFSQVNDSVE